MSNRRPAAAMIHGEQERGRMLAPLKADAASCKRMLGGSWQQRSQKVKVCSSAISMTGGPPDEIFAAWANVSFPPAEAAQACRMGSIGPGGQHSHECRVAISCDDGSGIGTVAGLKPSGRRGLTGCA